eukprot:CAMPEP_0174334994 /NCGR_PEP_ID=MMETSP0810-20121108/20385_1 /TAXON_ID=73025 ORGANISM="Eutreptiella gymnastica-like, Strain CCMP1594" /NCGR_SAMPLE_ID=MMETSP0810 /ASSEMBLY_ACC=CAM_ASM_000659 /LENGTH=39 /DNA_ID= /DNA_START= /DNA_END= /DNA_ORIENTATION=
MGNGKMAKALKLMETAPTVALTSADMGVVCAHKTRLSED